MNGRPLQGRRGCASRCVEGRRVDRVLSRSRPTSRTGEPSRARGLGPTSATSMEHHSAVRFAHDGPFSTSGSRTGHRPIARRGRSSHRPGDPDAADLPPHRSNRVTDSPSGFDLRRGGLPSWGMLGGGNRGRGVGNEPSRSLRGSGVVARLLRSELSAEHFPCPGSRDTAHPSRTSEIARELPRGRRHHERFAPPSSREPDSPDCRLQKL